jgi:hypothetical protein
MVLGEQSVSLTMSDEAFYLANQFRYSHAGLVVHLGGCDDSTPLLNSLIV